MEEALRNAAAGLLGEGRNRSFDLRICWFHIMQAIHRRMVDGLFSIDESLCTSQSYQTFITDKIAENKQGSVETHIHNLDKEAKSEEEFEERWLTHYSARVSHFFLLCFLTAHFTFRLRQQHRKNFISTSTGNTC